ncbi:MAG: L,D-transpeptidase family protein [Saprospiraceae bacterium]|nr:L,D-transpeptidase family protein [Saprospiraceae bacterium]
MKNRVAICCICLVFNQLIYGQQTSEPKEIIRDDAKNRLEKAVADMMGHVGDSVFVRAFKSENQLELWLKTDSLYHLFRTYPICNWSGDYGPKRKQGDMQVPEGFYQIVRFNPNSDYHLSLGINYPNASDLHFADPKKPGGAIYIHGSCGSHGCIPIGDTNIEEVYWLCWQAFQNGQKNIPVHIFPCRLTDEKLESLTNRYLLNRHFWENLQPGYQYFEKKKLVPVVEVEETGRYRIKY